MNIKAQILDALNNADIATVDTLLCQAGVRTNYVSHDNGSTFVEGFGKIRWDDQDPNAQGWVLYGLDGNGALEYDAWPVDADVLATQLTEVVGMATL